MPARADAASRLRIGAAILVIAAITFALYWNGLSGGFIFDDFSNLVTDTGWRMTRVTPDQVMHAFGGGIASGIGRGLAMVSFGLNHAATGMDPWPLKLTNLAMHVLAGLLVLDLTRRVYRHLSPEAPTPATAGFTAAAWLWHPLQVSTVLYIVQRMEIGAAIGVLASCIFYMEARERELRRQRGWPFLCAAALATAIGLGFKETALLAPGFTGLLEVFVLRFQGRSAGRSRKWLTFYAVGLTVALAVFAGYIVPHYAQSAAYASRDFGPGERLLTQPRVLAMYLGQILLPLPEHLRFYYDDFAVSTGWRSPASTLSAIALLLALVGVAITQARRRPLVSLGIAWFLMAHVLTSNVVPLELAFEHRNYLALLGVLWALAGLGMEVAARLSTGAKATLIVVLLTALAGACWVQTSTWGDATKLAVTLESRATGSARAAYAVGRVLYGLSKNDPASPAWSLARSQFERAADLDRRSILSDQALVLVDAHAQRATDADRWNRIRQKLAARGPRPEDVQALYSLVECSLDATCGIDRRQLGLTLDRVTRQAPDDPDLRIIHANFLLNVAHDATAAREQAAEAVDLRPNAVEYRIALARIMVASEGSDARTIDAMIEDLRARNRHGELDAALADIERLRRSRSGVPGR